MKPRALFFLAILLLILVFGVTIFAFATPDQEPVQIFPATVNRDCAPWDGSAFKVSVPIEESVIEISIYQSPEISRPVTFLFPDETMRDGNALLLLPSGFPEQLTGKVWFPRVDEGESVEGRFRLTSETGEQFEGRFIAEWENQTVYCG